MTMAESALRMEIEEAKAKIRAGEKPRDVFERVIFSEAHDQLKRDGK